MTPIPRAWAAHCRVTDSITARKALGNAAAALFWVVVWQLAAMAANRSLLLPIPTPVDTARALWRMALQGGFWLTVGASLLRICAGFLLALLLGGLCALAAARWPLFRQLTAPLVQLGLLPKTTQLCCYRLTGYSGGGKKMIAE